MATRLWVIQDAEGNIVKTFKNKKELQDYELGGDNAPLINEFLDEQVYPAETERGKKARRTADARVVARFLEWWQNRSD